MVGGFRLPLHVASTHLLYSTPYSYKVCRESSPSPRASCPTRVKQNSLGRSFLGQLRIARRPQWSACRPAPRSWPAEKPARMVRHNNVVPNQHFHKTLWQDHVKTWFDQAARKKRRRLARAKKAAALAPRPVGLLRPAVHPPTVKYNYKLRQGRGFTFAELKEAGIKKKEALSIGIAVDHRRRNRSAESLQLNAQRLKEYKAALILFPKKRGKPKAGDSGKEELAAAQQVSAKTVLPMPAIEKGEEAMTITAEMKADNVFHKLRVARADYRLFGIRQRNQ
eukprot:scaffold82705_cov30-Tisochrysis_lutea.AAC.1